MVRTGFVDVVEHPIAMPLNSWSTDPKQRAIGAITKINALGLIKALSLRILRAGLGWEEEAVNAFVALVENDFWNKEIPWYGTQ